MGLAQKGVANANTDYYHDTNKGCLSLLPFAGQRTFTVERLHPNVEEFARAIAARRDADIRTKSPAGRSLDVIVSGIVRDADNLRAQIVIVLDGTQAVHGQLTLATVYRRGVVALAHSLMGAVEILLDHSHQMTHLGRSDIRMAIGVVEITGTIDNAGALRSALQANISHPRDGGVPGFDPTLPFGLFPDEGFELFYGQRCSLRDEPLKAQE